MSVDASIPHLIQSALNGLLQLDPDARLGMQPLHGKRIRLVIEALDWVLVLAPEAGELVVLVDDGQPVDVSIRATPIALLRLARREQGAEQAVFLEGDMHTAQQLQRWFGTVAIDWEDVLARIIGDFPAHHIGRTLRSMTQYGQATGRRFAADVVEYLQFEKRSLPAQAAVDTFLAEVDRLRFDVDRLEARVRILREFRQ